MRIQRTMRAHFGFNEDAAASAELNEKIDFLSVTRTPMGDLPTELVILVRLVKLGVHEILKQRTLLRRSDDRVRGGPSLQSTRKTCV